MNNKEWNSVHYLVAQFIYQNNKNVLLAKTSFQLASKSHEFYE